MDIPSNIEKEIKAAIEYLLRRDRIDHPDGQTQKGNKWYPSDTERKTCCNSIRSPSRAYPWSLMTHCRTLPHIANLYDCDLDKVKDLLKKKNCMLLIGKNKHVDDLLEKLFKGEIKRL